LSRCRLQRSFFPVGSFHLIKNESTSAAPIRRELTGIGPRLVCDVKISS
jgi:hypothetical protein